eukprot:11705484-Ditylum_brightwellii.AAC.1
MQQWAVKQEMITKLLLLQMLHLKRQSNYKGNLWIDSGTNMGAMGRSFRMIEDTGMFAKMT